MKRGRLTPQQATTHERTATYDAASNLLTETVTTLTDPASGADYTTTGD